ncbi:hypothetical protein BC937DRAFT_90889 [Endogone sp. FLAS-F59071]|nr:hypothetical protein BC937DRAFT_90889 [Endogone sp. FLAS-F59071]|eukprot:RUS16712.1 hypothetical protein BC937DRAFT_90889 [Endogone sp. FLAS-F59071]
MNSRGCYHTKKMRIIEAVFSRFTFSFFHQDAISVGGKANGQDSVGVRVRVVRNGGKLAIVSVTMATTVVAGRYIVSMIDGVVGDCLGAAKPDR